MRVVLVALAVVLALPATAQRGRPFAERGDLALVAQVSGLDVLCLDPALGGIGVRYRLRDQTVIGLTVGGTFDDVSLDEGAPGVSTRLRSIDVALWNENHLGRGTRVVSPFVGGGVQFRAGERVQETSTVQTICDRDGVCEPVADTWRLETSSTSAGAAALVGAEVRLARGVTLGAAYGLGVQFTRENILGGQSGNGPVTQPYDVTFDRVSFGTGVTDLHLSVYF